MFPDDKLKAVMASMLDIDVSTVGPATSTDTVDQWDSVLHMNLIIAGHISSDTLGMNLILDRIEPRGVEVHCTSGIVRVRRS